MTHCTHDTHNVLITRYIKSSFFIIIIFIFIFIFIFYLPDNELIPSSSIREFSLFL